jgi:hypothetical protein
VFRSNLASSNRRAWRRSFAQLALIVACAACGSHDASTAASDSAAIAYVSQRYAQHFRTRQGFGSDTLRARESWFTPCLYSVLLADAQRADSLRELGFLNWDPFTRAQDDANGFRVVSATHAHDTVFVQVDGLFGYPPPGSPRPITVAVARVDTAWRIADFIAPDVDLVRFVDSSLRDLAVQEHRSYTSCLNRGH